MLLYLAQVSQSQTQGGTTGEAQPGQGGRFAVFPPWVKVLSLGGRPTVMF